MLIPSAIAASMAGSPAAVAGILTNTFGRASRRHRCRARSSVRVGVVGEVRLDLDRDEAIGSVGLVVDRPQDVGCVADVGDLDLLEDPPRCRAPAAISRRIRSSYWPLATALPKMVGLLVRPRIPIPTRSASFPLSISWRSMKSIHGLWSCSACSRCSVFIIDLLYEVTGAPLARRRRCGRRRSRPSRAARPASPTRA